MEELLQGLRAAAEPTRLRIVALCAHAELSVSDLTQILGQSQPRVSRHLRMLLDAGLLQRHREGTFAYFRLAAGHRTDGLARLIVDLLPPDDPIVTLDLERLQAIKEARAQQAMAYFAANAEDWDRIRVLHADDEAVEAALLGAVGPNPIGRLLDLGTGTGRILELLGQRADHAVGVDLSREMLNVARSKLERSHLNQIQIRHGNLYQLPFPNSSFDIAVMHQVLHFLEDPGEALAETARVLVPGGRLFIVDFEQHDLDDLARNHAHRWLGFTADQVESWLTKAGCAVDPVQRLAGESLNILLWQGRRRASNVTPLPPSQAQKATAS